MPQFLMQLFQAVIIQIAGVLGIFFAFGFVLCQLQTWTQINYVKTVGWKGILFTAWFGTPIHELGHAFFCKIFRHKIFSISLFAPNKQTGGLGHVDHSFNRFSLYQRLGNFFIGAAPMIWGSVFLWLMLYFLVPNGKEIFSPLSQITWQSSWQNILESLKQFFVLLFNTENLKAWNFWLFIYLSFCLSSHIAPSRPDQKQMWQGFFWIVLLLILFNILAGLVKINLTNYIFKINHYLVSLTAIFIYTTLISLTHWLLSVIILAPFKK